MQKQPREDPLCGLVIVERRHTAFVLNKLLEEMCIFDQDLFFLHSQHFVGQPTARTPRTAGADVSRKQEETLRRFRHRDVNLLETTPVLEEAFDVPRCNLVVKLEPPLHYKSYVQAKVGGLPLVSLFPCKLHVNKCHVTANV